MRAWVSAVSIVFAACSGGTTSGGSGGGASNSDIANLCAAQCDRDSRCGQADANCQTDCVKDIDHPQNYRSDFIAAFGECLKTLDCATSDDSCLTTAIDSVNPSWKDDALYKKCLARHSECDSFSDDTCAGAVYFTASARQTLEGCMNQPCDAIDACLTPIEN